MDVLVMVDATTMGLVNVNICGVDKIVLFLYVKMTVFKMVNVSKDVVNVMLDTKELIVNLKVVQDVVMIKVFVKKANVIASKDLVETIVK